MFFEHGYDIIYALALSVLDFLQPVILKADEDAVLELRFMTNWAKTLLDLGVNHKLILTQALRYLKTLTPTQLAQHESRAFKTFQAGDVMF